MDTPSAALARELLEALRHADRVIGDPPPRRGKHVALVRRIDQLKLKMYQERGHTLPHIHVDLGSKHHVASYALDPAKRLEGNLAKKHDRVVLSWIGRNRKALLVLWLQLQSGSSGELLLADLRNAA